jgi:hypothetical protein
MDIYGPLQQTQLLGSASSLRHTITAHQTFTNNDTETSVAHCRGHPESDLGLRGSCEGGHRGRPVGGVGVGNALADCRQHQPHPPGSPCVMPHSRHGAHHSHPAAANASSQHRRLRPSCSCMAPHGAWGTCLQGPRMACRTRTSATRQPLHQLPHGRHMFFSHTIKSQLPGSPCTMPHSRNPAPIGAVHWK